MPIAAAIPYITAAATVASTANQISASRKAQSAAKDALAAQKQVGEGLKYEPIDIEKLKSETREQAIFNATQSLALERELNPAVAATRQLVAERVRNDLALGGNLSADTTNQVARAARTMGSISGAPAGPITAATIGQTAEGLKQQRLTNATGLLSDNPLPTVGLDPGSLASEMVAQNAAQNQFNLQKAGVGANLAQSGAQVQGSAAGLQAGINANLLNKIPGIMSQISSLPVFQSSAATSTPALNNYTLPMGPIA